MSESPDPRLPAHIPASLSPAEAKIALVRQTIDELCGSTLDVEGALYHIATLVGAERGYDGSRDGELARIAHR